MAVPILRYGGVVNQFQGDAMLVTFNVPKEVPLHADNALRTAVEIQNILAQRTFAGMTLQTRMGINTGEVIAGNVGSGSRYNYTVHGDAVNTAARLEHLKNALETITLVSESTVATLEDTYPLRSMGNVRIRGKRDCVGVFALEATNNASS